jgi:hypothetical protein
MADFPRERLIRFAAGNPCETTHTKHNSRKYYWYTSQFILGFFNRTWKSIFVERPIPSPAKLPQTKPPIRLRPRPPVGSCSNRNIRGEGRLLCCVDEIQYNTTMTAAAICNVSIVKGCGWFRSEASKIFFRKDDTKVSGRK